jgi:hypothetical protein
MKCKYFRISSTPSALKRASSIASAHDNQGGLQGLGAYTTVVGFALGASKGVSALQQALSNLLIH